MSIKETLWRLVSGKPKDKRSAFTEVPGNSVQLYDLREDREAENRGVNPGYYLTAYPISPSDLKDSSLLHKLSLSFFEKLEEEGLLKQSDTRIHIDNKAEMFVDPARSWSFTPVGYDNARQVLIVKANQVDRDEAQRIIVSALRE